MPGFLLHARAPFLSRREMGAQPNILSFSSINRAAAKTVFAPTRLPAPLSALQQK